MGADTAMLSTTKAAASKTLQAAESAALPEPVANEVVPGIAEENAVAATIMYQIAVTSACVESAAEYASRENLNTA